MFQINFPDRISLQAEADSLFWEALVPFIVHDSNRIFMVRETREFVVQTQKSLNIQRKT